MSYLIFRISYTRLQLILFSFLIYTKLNVDILFVEAIILKQTNTFPALGGYKLNIRLRQK